MRRLTFCLAVCFIATTFCAVRFVQAGDANVDAAPKKQPPNFVLVMADDQGWGDVSFRGDSPVKTPVMDELAATCLNFDRFYAAAPVCSPTRGSVMTGRHPNRFGCFKWGNSLRTQEITIAEALKTAGYRTGHFGKWHLGDVWKGAVNSPGDAGFDTWLSAPNFFEVNAHLSREGTVIKTAGESSLVVADAALDFIKDAATQKKPFLAVVWFGSPHSPHVGTPEYLKHYEEHPKNKANFYAEITAMDAAVGNLRQGLKDLGVADNTVLWYTSDNGALGVGSTAGLRGNKGSIWEGGLRVPAMIEWPAAISQPRTISAPCGTVDIYPTLLELAGVTVEDQPPLDGVSLADTLRGAAPPTDRGLGFWQYPGGGNSTPSERILSDALARQQAGEPLPTHFPPPKIDEDHPIDFRRGHAAWVDGDWKLHRNAGYQLYNLQDDPAEQSDVAAANPQRVAEMKAALDAWQQSVMRSLAGQDY